MTPQTLRGCARGGSMLGSVPEMDADSTPAAEPLQKYSPEQVEEENILMVWSCGRTRLSGVEYRNGSTNMNRDKLKFRCRAITEKAATVLSKPVVARAARKSPIWEPAPPPELELLSARFRGTKGVGRRLRASDRVFEEDGDDDDDNHRWISILV
ncbi:hypothetical protein NEOLEDRAFT_1148907 [Neolentinus lepideus HHB14362 ss-1]|uniref:Uncharacterized protein n=1 Tax=Neolentinus lepideus HHB14362 ss-1 TaxID=1314782 RepID=A0A165RN31_9AGAM|nr:hypothetical protein NEOLEDRAFT_1148907 [Neolentinus lepideus HHB14362 ss-1]